MIDLEKLSDGYLTEDAIKQMIHKRIELSNYPFVLEEVNDDYLIIDSLLDIEQLILAYCGVKELIDWRPIFFFMAIYGGGNDLIGIGYKEDILGKIFYFSMDFGLFELDSSAAVFASKLCEHEGPFP